MEETVTTSSARPASVSAQSSSSAGADPGELASAALDLWATLLRVTNTIHARVSEDLAGLGITPEEIELLMKLSREPEERLRMVEVSRSLLLSKSGVTRLVDRLEQRGLVERAPCPGDRRVVYTALTEHGRQAFEKADPLLGAAIAEHLGRHLGAREIAAMRRCLNAVLAAEGDTNPRSNSAPSG